MTKEYGIVRVANGKLVEDGMFIPDSRLGELSGYSVRYLMTHGIHKNAVRLEHGIDDVIIWDGMYFGDVLEKLNDIKFERIMDIINNIPAKLDGNYKIRFKEED